VAQFNLKKDMKINIRNPRKTKTINSYTRSVTVYINFLKTVELTQSKYTV